MNAASPASYTSAKKRKNRSQIPHNHPGNAGQRHGDQGVGNIANDNHAVELQSSRPSVKRLRRGLEGIGISTTGIVEYEELYRLHRQHCGGNRVNNNPHAGAANTEPARKRRRGNVGELSQGEVVKYWTGDVVSVSHVHRDGSEEEPYYTITVRVNSIMSSCYINLLPINDPHVVEI